ncbi:MarR family winged helix-turn-helix transcriptional regulator [Geofilum sp. OHC36d9]|uniref:MarR family winged helix-turn-helix transcriptional regulator n=1 Tax=Geofilum sp. OHC36d9 TaxID=3458413 RepID=UPI0040334757
MDDFLKLKNQVCFPIYALSREIISHYRPFLESLDITYPQYLVLMVLWEEKTQTVNQLGGKLRLDSGTLTPLLKRLESKGLILRRRKSTDERVVEISLSEQGKQLRAKAVDVPTQLMESIPVTMDELIRLKEIVNDILDRMCSKNRNA